MRFYHRNFSHTLITAIHRAKTSIYLSMYRLSDPTLIGALIRAQKRGVSVTIHTDRGAKKAPTLKWCHYKGAGLMHEKLLVIDEKEAYIGTANGTEDSLLAHKNFLCGLYSPELARALLANIPHTKITIKDYELELWRLPQKNHQLIETLASLLENSKKSVSLSMFTLTQPQLIGALLACKKRNIPLQVELDRNSWKAMATCKKAGIEIALPPAYPLIHTKNAVIDNKYFIFGSTNWTKRAFNQNKEILIILNKKSC